MNNNNPTVRLLLGATLVLGGGFHPSQAGQAFEACLERLGQTMQQRGIAADVAQQQLAQAEYRGRVVAADRSQPEFVTTFTDYFEARVTEDRVERGRERLQQHRALLQRVQRDYGIPPHYLVAFWGLETNYGAYFGRVPVIDSLATLACDERRREFFTDQLEAALAIVERDAIAPERMRGSWAGAMGHLQFMPSVFRRYAVDYDGDGRRDLWNSLPDAMASAANYLRSIGWETGWRWGREVRLPADFPYGRAGRDRWRSLSTWRSLGVEDAFGRPLPRGDKQAAILAPAGHEGPAFVVYPNFRIIMEWNRSQSYALAVGRLADRIAGAAPLQQPPPKGLRLRREQVANLQRQLNERGFEAGPVDGIPGSQTRAAIRRFQREQGMIADGYPSQAVFDRLSLQVSRTGS